MPVTQPVSTSSLSSVASDRRWTESERDFRYYVFAVWRARLLVGGVALLFAIAGFTASWLTPRQYEASLFLGATQSKLGEDETASVNTANLRPIVYNYGIAQAVVKKFGLSAPPHNLDASRFLDRSLQVDEVRGTTLIRVKVRLRDPQLAANVANDAALRAIELARQLSQTEAVQVRDDIKTQVDEARARMEQAEAALVTYRTRARIELLKSDVDAMLKERGGLLKLDVDIAGERASLAKAEEELAKRDRLVVLSRSIDKSPALMESARAAGGTVLGLKLEEQQINAVYESLEQRVVKIRSNLAALERRRAQVFAEAKAAPKGADEPLARLYQHESTISRLEIERDLTRKIYGEVANQYENARLKVAGRSAQLQTIDPAYPPSLPLPRHTIRNTLGGGVLGALLGMIALFVALALKAPRQAG